MGMHVCGEEWNQHRTTSIGRQGNIRARSIGKQKADWEQIVVNPGWTHKTRVTDKLDVSMEEFGIDERLFINPLAA